MSTDENETDEWGSADEQVASEGENTADEPAATENRNTADDPGAPEDTPDDDPVSDYWLYVGIGLLTAVVAWLLIPLFGVGAVYAGYKLYESESRRVSGGILLVAGALPLVLFAVVLLQAV